MNTDRIKALADYIETNTCQFFDMENWLEVFDKEDPDDLERAKDRAEAAGTFLPEGFCGTGGCIAGHCVVMAEGVDKAKAFAHRSYEVMEKAQGYLGLHYTQREELFVPTDAGWNFPNGLESIKAADAVAALRHLAEHGEVDWSHVDGARCDEDY